MSLQREVRRAILSRLKSDPTLSAITSRIYSQSTPANVTWPFVRLGPPSTKPLRASCMPRGGIVTIDVHAFAKPRSNGTGIVETAEDYADRIGTAIEKSLDGIGIPVTGGNIHLLLSEMRLMQDGQEADAYHYFCQVTAKCLVA